MVARDNGIEFMEELLSAYYKSTRAMEMDRKKGENLESEFLIYLSGDTQIERVFKKYGISDEESNYFIIYLDDSDKNYGMEERKKVFSDDTKKLKEKMEKISMVELKK